LPVPISATDGIKMLYVFVDIQIDIIHFIDTVKHNFKENSKLALVSTVQFISSLQVRVSGYLSYQTFSYLGVVLSV